MSANSRKINLLPPSDFELSFWGKFLKWAVTTGRYIIILTELVVIIAFISRFKLDNDIAQLNEAIEGKKHVLEANMAAEQQFRQVQARISAVSKVIGNRKEHTKMLENLLSVLPGEIKLDSLSTQKTGLLITATAIDEKAIGLLLARLNTSDNWKGVMLTQLTSDQQKGIKFTVEVRSK